MTEWWPVHTPPRSVRCHGTGVVEMRRSSFAGRWGQLIAAVVGAVLLEAITYALNPSISEANVPKFVSSLVVGAIVGWMYELLRDTRHRSGELVREAATVTSRLNYYDRALQMLSECPRHGAALHSLISASVSQNFQFIPYVEVGHYRDQLDLAVDHADRFEGIQRKPVSWFRTTGAEEYLGRLGEKRMRSKVRIFVIDDADVAQMESDLADVSVMDFYWSCTGDVETFWISVGDLKDHFPRIAVPADSALFDRQLYIAYAPQYKVLEFGVVLDGDGQRKVFEELEEQLRQERSGPFIRIERRAAGRSRIVSEDGALVTVEGER
jgi:uncharacterized membrane protein YeaQ/YmgE (transglycosylase-associated protein family)